MIIGRVKDKIIMVIGYGGFRLLEFFRNSSLFDVFVYICVCACLCVNKVYLYFYYLFLIVS